MLIMMAVVGGDSCGDDTNNDGCGCGDDGGFGVEWMIMMMM